MSYYAKRFFGQTQSEGIIKDGLKLWLDASNPASYSGSGTTWYDLSGNGNNGTMVNGVTPVSNAMRFDGVNDYVSIPTPIIAKSVSCWINVFEVSTVRYFIGTIDGPNGGGGIRYNGTSFLVYHGGQTANPPAIAVNWTKANSMVNFTAIDKNDGYWDIYINGVFIGTSFSSIDRLTFRVSMLGNRPTQSFYFKGPMNDITIYDRALTPSEVLYNFNVTKSKYGL